MSIITVLLVIVTASLLAVQIQAQNSGDIRLVNNKNSDSLVTFHGRLEVFINGKWETICGSIVAVLIYRL